MQRVTIGVMNALAAAVRQQFPLINHGGCARLTAIVADALRQRDIEAHAVRFDWWDTTIDDDTFTHVALRLTLDGEEWEWDSDGLREPQCEWCEATLIGTLELPRLIEIATYGSWNRMFDRSSIPALRRLVRRYLGKWGATEVV